MLVRSGRNRQLYLLCELPIQKTVFAAIRQQLHVESALGQLISDPSCVPIFVFPQAGNAAASFLGLIPVARVVPVEPDEPQIAAAKDFLRTQRQVQQLVTGGLSDVFANLTGSSSSSARQAEVGYTHSPSRSKTVTAVPVAAAVSSSTEAEQQAASSSSGRGGGLSLLQQDEQLQELLRDEVVQQVAEQDLKRQQQQQQATQSAVQQ